MQITTQNIIYQLSKQCSSIPLTDKHEGMKDKFLALHAWVHGAAYVCCGNKIQHNDATIITAAVRHTALLSGVCFLI
jgi:azurin